LKILKLRNVDWIAIAREVLNAAFQSDQVAHQRLFELGIDLPMF
jgi:hypothetical protein